MTDKSYYLKNLHCSVPLSNVLIDEQGDIYKCFCQAWLPHPIGNIINIESKQEFLDLDNNNFVKDSILDSSHKFCREDLCAALQQIKYNNFNKNFISPERIPAHTLSRLQLVIDPSCNLKCPTCRSDLILKHNDQAFQTRLQNILDKIDQIFFNPLEIKEVFLLGNGEFLASNKIKNWIFEKANQYPRLRFLLQTNGTLIYTYKEKLEPVFKSTYLLLISIDASNKDVYAKTRINGNWDHLVAGLDWLNEKFPHLKINFNYVVSSNNYYDMNDFINFVKKYNICKIYFSRVQKWEHLWQSDSDWKNLNIFDEKHILFSNFIEKLKQVDFKNESIQCNFLDFINENKI